MEQPRGMGALLFILAVGGLLALLFWTTMGRNSESVAHDPEKFTEALMDRGLSEEQADHNVGVVYSLTSLAAQAQGVQERYGSYEPLCENGKVTRTEPEIVKDLTWIVCGPNACTEEPYVYRAVADARCYATKDRYAISAKTYDTDGTLLPMCIDTRDIYDVYAADPTTVRCKPLY